MEENGGPSTKRQKTAQIDANDAITIHFLDAQKEPAEIYEQSQCPPDMCHQFFGDEEMINGYEDLKVDIWLSQKSFEALLEVQYSTKMTDADDIEKALRGKFTAGLSTKREEYLKKLKEAPPLRLESLGKPVLERGEGPTSLSVYRIQLCKADQCVRDLHAHLQPLLMFFVDGACAINIEEPNWELLLAVHAEGDTLITVGFATIYSFWCWPEKTRIRVAQVLVLPPYQTKGIGRALMESVYVTADERGAIDVTFEEPTDHMQWVRERIELQRAAKLPWLINLAARTVKSLAGPAAAGAAGPSAAAADAASPSSGELVDSAEAAAQAVLGQQDHSKAMAELRVSKMQVRKLWEVLLYAQPGWESSAQRNATVEALVRARLVGGVTSTKRVAEGKRIFNVPNEGRTFYMIKVPRDSELGPGAGVPVAMNEQEAEGQSPEEREAALNEEVAKRMGHLKELGIYLKRLL